MDCFGPQRSQSDGKEILRNCKNGNDNIKSKIQLSKIFERWSKMDSLFLNLEIQCCFSLQTGFSPHCHILKKIKDLIPFTTRITHHISLMSAFYMDRAAI